MRHETSERKTLRKHSKDLVTGALRSCEKSTKRIIWRTSQNILHELGSRRHRSEDAGRELNQQALQAVGERAPLLFLPSVREFHSQRWAERNSTPSMFVRRCRQAPGGKTIHLAGTVANRAHISGEDWSRYWRKDSQFARESF